MRRGDKEAARDPRWSPDTLLQEIEKSELSIKDICKKYSKSPDKWRGAYLDVCKWRHSDQSLDQKVEEYKIKMSHNGRETFSGGRPRNDENDPDWKVRFCQELVAKNSRLKAAEVTPYDYDTIYRMLNERYREYDRDFADMVHVTEMRMVARAEEVIWQALEDEEMPRNKAWIAERILRVRDRERWGDKLDVDIKGKVTHQLIAGGELAARLVSSQRGFFNPEPKKLESGELLEAEVVDD